MNSGKKQKQEVRSEGSQIEQEAWPGRVLA